ncbi:Two-component response regulator, SAPR family, consists of REC, wHTH and BTAD domains [Gracilibacillus orientalis]|uniref:Two-component response regulator, SAPR family, consists of REC, wHTH and BTAD domains n=1 Tax=Gracilibacillus orientalis TaxID=334253 RepID=A0A1I4R2T7_9BACI|nr:response regulator [Gracilibacillus orientalis]SFM46618.1 Two-component response regulator, SAPR family, consists of REC, wHTH and BTAD domains [Gracilibacillus orientalis]
MNIVLFDDEPLALDFLEHQLNLVRNVNVIGKYSHANVEAVSENIKKSDVIFLDIKMPGLNGLELAETILKIKPDLPIVFVTAYDKYAIQAFELNALDYILKPVQLNRLKKTVKRIESYIKNSSINPYESAKHLTINVLGEFTFQLNSDDTRIISWRTTNAQETFLYLLHHHSKIVSKSELVELLFPNMDVNKANSLLYVTIYQVRQALSEFNKYISIRSIQNGYVLKLDNTSIDKEVWENELDKAPKIDIKTLDQQEKIMSYYKGTYLKKHDYLWAEGERYRLETIWVNHAFKIANYYYKHHFFDKSAIWFIQLSDLVPEDESVNFALMKIYAWKGYGVLVEHQYNQLKKSLEEFNLSVNKDIDKWYHDWKSSKGK